MAPLRQVRRQPHFTLLPDILLALKKAWLYTHNKFEQIIAVIRPGFITSKVTDFEFSIIIIGNGLNRMKDGSNVKVRNNENQFENNY